MRIAIIGNFDKDSYASVLADELNKKHTAYIFNTRELGYDQSKRHKISDVLRSSLTKPEYIIVVQSHALLHNDTDIPLYLYKRELGPLTVDNPTKILYKYLLYNDKKNHKNILHAAINPSRYNPDREKDIIMSDIESWYTMGFERYRDILERSQYHMVKAYSISVRTLEALACKTIPIIIYVMPELKKAYEEMGIDDSMVVFTQIANWQQTKLIMAYDENMAEKGYDFCINNLTIKNRAQQILEVIENG